MKSHVQHFRRTAHDLKALALDEFVFHLKTINSEWDLLGLLTLGEFAIELVLVLRKGYDDQIS